MTTEEYREMKMLELKQKLLEIEAERRAGARYYTVEEVAQMMEEAIQNAKKR